MRNNKKMRAIIRKRIKETEKERKEDIGRGEGKRKL
jgi:hypothetical protein